MQYYYVRRCLYEKKGEFISPLTIMTVFLRLFLCYISCLFLIHLKKKWQLCTEVYGNEEEFNKQSSKAHLWILFFNYVSEVNRSQSVVYSSGKQSMCLKNFAWSQLQHAESLSTVSANVLLKLYFFSKCQLVWKDVYVFGGAVYHLPFYVPITVWTNALFYIVLLYTELSSYYYIVRVRQWLQCVFVVPNCLST